MQLKTILKLMEKKYPAGDEAGWLGALLILYDDGGGFIKRTRKIYEQEQEYDDSYNAYSTHLFIFSNLEELIAHLKEK